MTPMISSLLWRQGLQVRIKTIETWIQHSLKLSPLPSLVVTAAFIAEVRDKQRRVFVQTRNLGDLFSFPVVHTDADTHWETHVAATQSSELALADFGGSRTMTMEFTRKK